MSLVDNVLAGAIGYCISEVSGSHPVREFMNRNIGNSTLRDIITQYARNRRGIYGQNNSLAKELHDIARSFEEYNYEQVYPNY